MLKLTGLHILIICTFFSVESLYPQNLWNLVIGGEYGDHALSITPSMNADEYIVCGSTGTSSQAGEDAFLLKLNTDGDTLWMREYGKGGGKQKFYSVLQNPDSTIAALGYSSGSGINLYDMWFVKTDSNGDTLFTRSFGMNSMEWGLRLKKISGGYFLLGFIDKIQLGDTDIQLIKITDEGDVIWSKTYGGAGNDWAADMILLPDSGLILGGFTESRGNGLRDVWLIRLNPQGDTLWSKTYGGTGNDWIRAMHMLPDGDIILAGGHSADEESSSDAWLAKVDSLGIILWDKTYGGESEDYVYSTVTQTRGGKLAFIGSTSSFGAGNSEMLFVLTDSLGNPERLMTYGDSLFENGSALVETDDGGFILAGSTTTFGNSGTQSSHNIWIVKTDSMGITDQFFTGNSEAPYITGSYQLYDNYPNPFNPATTIIFSLPHPAYVKLTIYNTLGREVENLLHSGMPAGRHRVTFHAANLPSGIYFYRLETGNFSQTKKMMLLR